MSALPDNILCETSTVTDGNMSFRSETHDEVMKNRIQFLKKHGVSSSNYLPMHCDHGEIITIVDSAHPILKTAEPDKWVQSEVLVTQSKNLALFLLTADCQPMSFYDPVTQTIALAHISRVTLENILPQKTAGFLRDTLRVNPANLLVHIGPHIKKESYVFTLPLLNTHVELADFIEEKDGHAYIDLLGASLAQLTSAGIEADNISISPIDTGTSNDHYSYFRMKKEGVPDSARMATILMMR